jgi:hypothetical protein
MESVNNKAEETKRRKIGKQLLLFVIVVVAGWLTFHAYYKYNTGLRSGIVIDAETGQPLAGAVVNIRWVTPGLMETAPGRVAAFCEILTDQYGRYSIPNQHFVDPDSFLFVLLQDLDDERVLVYKEYYSAYQTSRSNKGIYGRTFSGGEQSYTRINNVIKLYPWKENWSHEKHAEWFENYKTGSIMKIKYEFEYELGEKERTQKYSKESP